MHQPGQRHHYGDQLAVRHAGLVHAVPQPGRPDRDLPSHPAAFDHGADCTGIIPPIATTRPTQPVAACQLTAGPVYAEYNAAKNLLVVADYDGGTISVIDVSLDEYGNDSATFGTTYTIPVGNNPASVTVLYDGSRAYTANQTDQTVTIANLSSYTVEKTLPVTGYPRTVVSTQNSTYGKVYVASPNSNYLTIIRTDQDIVDTTVLLEGNIVDVRVSTQNGISGNNNNVSRIPGYGQPCNLPPASWHPTTASATPWPIARSSRSALHRIEVIQTAKEDFSREGRLLWLFLRLLWQLLASV